MKFESIRTLIFDNLQAAFDELDRWDWGHQRGSYQHLKQEFINQPQGYSEPKLQNRLIQLVTLLDSPEHNTKEPRLLTPPPFIPELFLGRGADLEAVYHKLFHEEHLLLLVNGQGGIGKTTLAAKYWERYKSQYSHVAWVFAGDDLTQALLALAPKLKLSFPETLPNTERLPLLIQELCALDKPCLLIIDNANDLPELEKHYLALRSCSNFHILLTSRITEFEQAARHAILPLEQAQAVDLFQRHYPKYQSSEEALLLQIFEAVGYNTLVIELLAKNLSTLNAFGEQYTLSTLLKDLQRHGVLGMSKTEAVKVAYQAAGPALRKALPEAIIAAMYKVWELSKVEKKLLSILAVLPAERIEVPVLKNLLNLRPSVHQDRGLRLWWRKFSTWVDNNFIAFRFHQSEFTQSLSTLAQKGWIEHGAAAHTLKISPVIQQIVRVHNKATLKSDCQILIDSLLEQLNWETYGHYSDYQLMGKLSDYATSLLSCFQDLDVNLALLCERVGDYYQVTGNLNAALQYFEQYQSMCKKLLKKHLLESIYKNNLAVSYERLGAIHRELGNLEKALSFFELDLKLRKALKRWHPLNKKYKHNLAVPYERLGSIHGELGNVEKALSFYELYLKLSKGLHRSYPQNVGYKNSLANSYSQLGSIHRELGNVEKALVFFELDLELSKELHRSYPQNVGYKNGLAISYSQLGDIHRELADLEKALSFFEQYYEIEKELHATYPQNVGYKNSLAISYSQLGSIHRKLGNVEKALSFFELYFELRQELHRYYPQNVGYKNRLGISYAQLGDIHRQLGNMETALSFFEQEMTLFEELHSSYPQNVGYKNSLAISYSQLGDIHRQLGNMEKALSFFELDLELSKELHRSHPQNVGYKNSLAISYAKLGMIHLQQNNLAQATQDFEQYHSLAAAIYHAVPANVRYYCDYAESLAVRAALHKLEGQEVSSDLNTAAQHLETLYQKSPRDHYQKKLALIHQMQAAEGDALKELIIAISKD